MYGHEISCKHILPSLCKRRLQKQNLAAVRVRFAWPKKIYEVIRSAV